MINPILYTEKIANDFLKYQLTSYPFADTGLYDQMKRLLNLEETRNTPLLKGPYISLSRSFREGAKVSALVKEKLLHPHLLNLVNHKNFYGHQEDAIRSIHNGFNTLISTGTGSGKTECFLYPIISRCLDLKDENADPGIVAAIVYPMNALAEDQIHRIRALLAGSGISFGIYIGKSPERKSDIKGKRMPDGSSRADYLKELEKIEREGGNYTLHPAEERVAREEMRKKGGQPRILLTNVKQLELLLTRQQDIGIFDNAFLNYLVFDEAHTFRGAAGSETACLVRRLRSFCGKKNTETVCIATSATIVDPVKGADAGREFAERFFGVPQKSVGIVGEQYEPDKWHEKRQTPPALPGTPSVHLDNILKAIGNSEKDGGASLADIFRAVTGEKVDRKNIFDSIYESLNRNEIVFQISEILTEARSLVELKTSLAKKIGRKISEEEILFWLALGATARRDGRPLLRPVIHAFIRGVGGACVTFPEDTAGAKLWLSPEDANQEQENKYQTLPILTCTTCGQHYFEGFFEDWKFTDSRPSGGSASENGSFWRTLDKANGGKRAVLTDKLLNSDEDDDEPGSARLEEIYMCRICGALHPDNTARCRACSSLVPLVRLYAVKEKADHPGFLSSCVSCHAHGRNQGGRGYREPARPVRALTVSDVHILAQSMIQHAEHRRLLVFADNRQDAAFQAGWMKDRARRFRLRSLMFKGIQEGPKSVNDQTYYLEKLFDADDALSRTLLPEVWQTARKEVAGTKHGEERKKYLQIQVIRELAFGLKQTKALEAWGRMKIEYMGLSDKFEFYRKWAPKLGLSSQDLLEGVCAVLDIFRRQQLLFNQEQNIFSRTWHESREEVMRGYIPMLKGVPAGLKLRRLPDDNKNWVKQVLSDRGDTLGRQIAKKWSVPDDEISVFWEDLWKMLTEETKILRQVDLMGKRNRLPNCSGVYQIDSDLVRMHPNKGLFRCGICGRASLRKSPGMKCLAYRCDGSMEFVEENPDSYDLMLLDNPNFCMIFAEEHSAQVPQDRREDLERMFKSSSEYPNTLVCTPTLEMGVDIGNLDAILMRNVPPLPSNYWQRAGRAGRRHRMALNVTYSRPASHDRAYFKDPLKMLGGTVYPPSINLSNELMLRKHIHASLLTTLNKMAGENGDLPEENRNEIGEMLKTCFPSQIKSYLFLENGAVRRDGPLLLDSFGKIIVAYREKLLAIVYKTFKEGWPEKDAAVLEENTVGAIIDEACDNLNAVVKRLFRRLSWAMAQIRNLNDIRDREGTLNPEEEALSRRCDTLVKKYKGILSRRKQEAEGYDDTSTYSVLAAEGFLPGYGLDTGSVKGFAEMPRYSVSSSDFVLPRPSAVALREYVPGNMIYANGNRFVPKQFEFCAENPVPYQVDITNEAVRESAGGAAGGIGVKFLNTVELCDVILTHNSHISDEDDYRFQLAVAIYGYEMERHKGGKAYNWGERQLHFRKGVFYKLVNVGPLNLVREKSLLGYPVCFACGQSRSPFASRGELDNFRADHQERCRRTPENIGFFASVVADSITLKACADRTEAYSVAESLRQAASFVLDMEQEDLQVMMISRPGETEVDAVIFDPMPGGSGLLEQILSNWETIVQAATEIVDKCPSECESGCVDCLYTFRNAFYHRYLNRKKAAEIISINGAKIKSAHDIPALMPQSPGTADSTNKAEDTLKDLLIRAGFPPPVGQKEINLGPPLNITTPDFYYEIEAGHIDAVCIYLDGLSKHIHGNPATRQRDIEIRTHLKNNGYEVIEIAYSQLSDKGAMANYFYRLGRIMLGRDKAAGIKGSVDSWFEFGGSEVKRQELPHCQIDSMIVREPVESDKYVTCLPFYPLEIAAGYFGEGSSVPPEPEFWMRLDVKKISKDMFVSKITGKSMEPKIPDGSYCLFRAGEALVGSRNGRFIVIRHSGINDPETGFSFTLKKYKSEKQFLPDGSFRHVSISLKPLNTDFHPIELKVEEESDIKVVAEFLQVVK